MRKIKYCIPSFLFYDRVGIESYLKSQAEKGWLLEKVSVTFWKFRRIEPRRIHFAVAYFPDAVEYDPMPNEKQNIFREFCAQAGWKLAAAGSRFQIFCHEGENPVPMETDPILELETIHKAAKKRFLPLYSTLLGLSLIFLLLWVRNLRGNLVETLSSNLGLLKPVIILDFIALSASNLTGYFLWRRKAKIEAKQTGEFLPAGSSRCLFRALELLIDLSVFAVFWSAGGIKGVILGAVVLAGYLLIIEVIHRLRKLLQSKEVSVEANRIVSFVAALALVLTFGNGGINVVSRALNAVFPGEESQVCVVNNRVLRLYADEIPLTLEDLGGELEIPSSNQYVNSSDSLLMSREICIQQTTEEGRQKNVLFYNVIDVKQEWVYDTVLDNLKDPEIDDNMAVIYGGYFSELRLMDAVPWGADAAWQCYSSDGTSMDSYLLCYGSRILVLSCETELTEAQMAIIGKVLG